MIESYSTGHIRQHRNIVIFMVLSPLLTMFLLSVTLFIGTNVNRNVNAADSLLFDGSKYTNWPGKQLGNGCGSSIKDVNSVPPGMSGTSIQLYLADGCKWSSDGTDNRERAELVVPKENMSFREGTTWYIDFWQRFDKLANPYNSDWDIWLQTHYPGGGQPNLIFASDQGNRIEFKTSQGCGHTVQWSGPVAQVGKWYHFTLGVKFSAQSSNGWVQLAVDGNTVLPRKNVATLTSPNKTCSSEGSAFDGTWGYLKKGVYRSGNFTGDEQYSIYALKVYSSDPTSTTSKPTPTTSLTPTPSPTPALITPPSIPTQSVPSISVPGANPTVPVSIPVTLPKEADGTLIADFNGDGINDVVRDTNNDGEIDPSTEIIETTDELPEVANSDIATVKPVQNPDTITFKAGPLPQVVIAKPVAYTFAIAQGVLITGLASYLAITKLTIFAGVRGRLGL